MTDFKSRLANAKLPERTVPICLRGDLVAEFEDLERQLTEALQASTDSLEKAAPEGIAERMEQLRQEMRDETEIFRLRAMPRPRWRAFIAEHPPRKGEDGEVDERDRATGVNMDTFYEALIQESVIAPVIDAEDWPVLIEALTSRQFDELADAAWGLNRREVDIPFSPAASRMIRGSGTE
ncbi:hypothetical protein [Micromonospora sp. DT229]|uniref:hypothetical protein n=1 Tax=Micromonospora sp. DT229 TaxID=3393430 RepID=UPI003CEFAFB7